MPAPSIPSTTSSVPVASTTVSDLLPEGLTRRQDSPHWWIDLMWHGLRIRRSTGTADLGRAIAVLRRIEEEGPDVVSGNQRRERTIEDLLERLEAEARAGTIAPRTLLLYRTHLLGLASFMREELGVPPELRRLTERVIRDHQDHRARTPIARNGRHQGNLRPPCARTLNNGLNHLRACFRRACAWGWMSSEPTGRIRRNPKAFQPRVRSLATQDLRTLFEGVTKVQDELRDQGRSMVPFLRPFLEVVLGLGLRREEARVLTFNDVDLGHRTVTIGPKDLDLSVLLPMGLEEWEVVQEARDRDRRPGRPRIPTDIPTSALKDARYDHGTQTLMVPYRMSWHPKGGYQSRRVPIPDHIHGIMRDLVGKRLEDWFPMDPLVNARQRWGLPPVQLLFPGREGGLLRHSLNTLVHRSARIAGITPPRIHDLRHTYATMLRRRGVELATIQRLLGHRDLDSTMIYADFTDEEARRAASVIGW